MKEFQINKRKKIMLTLIDKMKLLKIIVNIFKQLNNTHFLDLEWELMDIYLVSNH